MPDSVHIDDCNMASKNTGPLTRDQARQLLSESKRGPLPDPARNPTAASSTPASIIGGGPRRPAFRLPAC